MKSAPALLCLMIATAIDPAAAAAGPEVVRVRVPAGDVTRYFPPGTGLRILSPEDFEARVAAMGREASARRAAAAPRLLRARHRARWESGLLRGRTELVIGSGPAGPAELPLEPWTPAILVEAGTAPAVGARDTGTAVLRIPATPRQQTTSIHWEQQARPNSGGRGFALGLPAVATTVLELELPAGWTAASRRGVRRGPLPTADPATSLWEIDGEAGRFDLVVRDPSDRGQAATGAGAWMTTETELDLRRSPDPAGSIVNWTAECRIQLGARHAGRIAVELDPGLELIDVQGEAVQGYHAERPGAGTRVTVAIAEAVRTTRLRLLAHASVPSEGAWPIPAVRPLDATWTGGRTTVILGERQVVSECRERAGRLVPPAREEAAAAGRLAFEAASPRSVADLVFVRPRAELACLVRGRLLLSGTPARLDCRLDWTHQRGPVTQLEIDISPGWSPDQVRIQGMDDPVAWHSSPLPSGGTRLRVMPPASVMASGRWTLSIGATAGATASRGPLDLPRVRPVAALAAADEAWLALGDDGTAVRPVRARGLAWIDPADVPGLANPAPPPGLRQVLAWRWTGDDRAEARVDRERIDNDPRVSIHARARMTPDGRTLSIEGTLLVGSGGAALEALPIWVDATGDALASWRFRGEDGDELRPRPLGPDARDRLRLGPDASARALPLDLAPHGRKTVTFRADLPWSSPGFVPLLFVARESLGQGTMRIETPAGMRSRVRADGLGRLHPATAVAGDGDPLAARIDVTATDESGDRVVRAFSYTEPGGRLELIAEPMTATPLPGLVREAWLSTSWDGRGRTLNRLRLLVQPGPSGSLSLDLPRGAEVMRVLQDGAAAIPVRSGDRISIPAAAPGGAGRPRLVVVDYRVDAGRLGDGSILRPDRPQPSIPCLSFTWEVSAPPGWRLMDPGHGLLAVDRDDPHGWPVGVLGMRWPDWWPIPGRDRPDLADRLRQLDGRLGRPPAEELTFAEWFSRWDAGPSPVVVDRLALGASGLGPKSSCTPGRLDAEHRDSARRLLQQHRLSAVAFADALLITTESEARRFDRREPWLDAIDEALAWGSDRTDRFQSVARWRGETATRTATATEPSGGGDRLPPGREIRRFAATGWPGADAHVRLVDAPRRALLGWIVAGLLGLAWIVMPGARGGRRLILPAAVLAGSVLLERILPSRYAAMTAGGLVGSLAILVAELSRRIRWPRPAPSPGRPDGSSIRSVARAAAAMILLLAATIGPLRAGPADDPPIVALFPYEGTFDPGRPPDRVVLRLEDFRRLTPASGAAAAPTSTVTALASGHRVSRVSAREILVETEIELAARGAGPFAWRIPVALARDVSARIGGEPVPIAVEPGGRTATVTLPGAGNFLLSLRRSAAARADETGAEVLSLPVNPTPAARLIVVPPADGVPQGVAVARGRVERKPDQTLDGPLGPSDRIVVRWTTGRATAIRNAGPVEGLFLWDVTPAGDRLRARLTYHRSDEIDAVRITHDAGVLLQSASVPGGSRVYVERNAGVDEWRLSFDPPLPPTAEVALECWRPASEAEDRDGSPGPGGLAKPKLREFPRIRPAAAERFSGVFGVRRPGDWTGRLSPPRDDEPLDDEAFVKAWGGMLPDEPLTLCGTGRLVRDVEARLSTGPIPPRLIVRPSVQVRIESGRVVVVAEADVEASAHAPMAVAELPEGMRVVRVSGDGLVAWSSASDRRLRLTWTRRDARARGRVRIVGWIPVEENALEVGVRPRRLRTPWVTWPGAEVGSGTLTIFSAVAAEIRGGTGLAPAPVPATTVPFAGAEMGATDAIEGASSPPGPRLSFVVTDPGRLGELSWESRPPKVVVTVESQVTIDPDFAHWVAVVRYDILGGALDRIDLKIPSAWSARAKVSHSGDGRRPSSRVSEPFAFWSIRPDRPLWGSHRLVLRSSLPIGTAREVLFPDVAPLGKQGAVDTYLALVNATGHPPVAEDATGLRPISATGRFRDEEFDHNAATPVRGFRVVDEPWALRVQLPAGAAGSPGALDDAARVALADLTVSVRPDRSATGRAFYEIRPDSGRLLTVELPPGGTILWAAVEPRPAVPLRAGPSAWSIPIDPTRPQRVCLIWKTPPETGDPGPDRWTLPLPRAGSGSSLATLSVRMPDGLSIDRIPAGLEAATASRLDTVRAEWLGQSIRALLPGLDRSSGRDHEHLVALLIEHEMALRAAGRAAGRDRSSPAASQEILATVEATRTALAEAVRSAGLADDLGAAEAYLGLAQNPTNRRAVGLPEPIVPCRIRDIGRPAAAVGTLPGLDAKAAPAALTFAGSARGGPAPFDMDRSLLLAAAMAAGLIAATAMEGRRKHVAAAVALVPLLAASAWVGGPWMLGGGLLIAAIGRGGERPSD